VAQPCNQFGGQEPLSGQDLFNHLQKKWQPKFIGNFCDKADVNGKNATELFLFLQNHPNGKGALGMNSIKWNFSKFLVGRDGVPIKRFGPQDAPLSFEDDIVRALEEEAPELD